MSIKSYTSNTNPTNTKSPAKRKTPQHIEYTNILLNRHYTEQGKI